MVDNGLRPNPPYDYFRFAAFIYNEWFLLFANVMVDNGLRPNPPYDWGFALYQTITKICEWRSLG